MTSSIFILHMAGAITMLLWATRLVRTGIERAYGRQLRRNLRKRVNHPFTAMLFGVVMAIGLQSSTAVTLLISSFTGMGLVSGTAGVIIVRGGELGSAIVAKLLSYDMTLLIPILILIGAGMYLRTDRRPWHELGRSLIGIAMILLSLELLSTAAGPLRESQTLPLILNFLEGDLISSFLIAAVFTYLLHSSVAAILLLAALASQGLLPGELGVVMVLGVNLGSSLIAPILTRSAEPSYRAVPLANLLMRGLGSVLLLIAMGMMQPDVGFLGMSPEQQIINGHIAFNLLILIVGLPLSGLTWRISRGWADLSARPQAASIPEELSALDPEALDRPEQALANATREAVRMCETIEIMLSRIMDIYEEPTPEAVEELIQQDDWVDKRQNAIKLYLAQITEKAMTVEQARHCQNLLEVCIKLEQAGDVIVRNLVPHVQKKMERQVEFTPEGWRELLDFHNAVMRNARLSFNLLVNGDPETAHRVIAAKDRLRARERETRQRHFNRLRQGTEESIETSSIHLDTVRDLKQINGLLAAIAYPVLEEEGLLRGSRLIKPGKKSKSA
ncbi:Na/Pi cotransporter family protein [Rhodobacteraceae bacterium F11138]|nr:Na/Pi cotransporter family protein [Rhodobacteraceae bacterium F11138]